MEVPARRAEQRDMGRGVPVAQARCRGILGQTHRRLLVGHRILSGGHRPAHARAAKAGEVPGHWGRPRQL
eukprot:4269210-Lingulodinium_polyedra.AAC.1